MKLILPKAAAYVLSNVQLNATTDWKHRRCTKCGRHYPDTVLNVQEVIVEGATLQCVNRQSCDAFRKQVRR